MVDLIPGNLIGIVLDSAAQHCFLPSNGHWAISTECGVEATAISCIGVEGGLQTLQVPRHTKSCISDHGMQICKRACHAHDPHQPVGKPRKSLRQASLKYADCLRKHCPREPLRQ